MTVPVWQPATIYLPGAIVQPRSAQTLVVQAQPYNNSFEDGLTNWDITPSGPAGACSQSSEEAFDGTYSALFSGYEGSGTRSSATATLTNSFMAPVKPGQSIAFSCMIQYTVGPNPNGAFANGSCGIAWYNADMAFISYSEASSPASPGAPRGGTPGYASQVQNTWQKSSGTGIAPAGAAYAAAVIWLNNNTSGSSVYADLYQWNYTEPFSASGLLFVATQVGPGVSGKTEPTWPLEDGITVQDNTVTWEGEIASQITWQASSILTTGATEPDWSTTVGGAVKDNTIIWTASCGLVTDQNCPNTTQVAIGSAKIFAANKDIINFCATANPLDWTSSQDAGFLPFGLQTYGNEDCLGLGLYRSNLVAFNSLGYQLWQIDPDPANMAILDAEPVGCTYHKSIQPVNNDLCFLSPVGIRSIGIAGASGNLQAGQFGKQIDPLVKAALAALPITGYEPKSLFYSGAGQYWLFFGPEAFVLTINGTSTMSWSRYVFPDTITDWTVLDSVLYIRAGDLVWEVDELQALDDFITESESLPFQCYLSWEYLDFGVVGIDKQMEGFDIGMKGSAQISFGYVQNNRAIATDWYPVTETIPGTMIPMPMTAPSFQARLQFAPGQIAPITGGTDEVVGGYPVAEWSVLSVYVTLQAKQ